MEAVHKVSTATILWREKIFAFFHNKPLCESPLTLGLDWIFVKEGGGEGGEEEGRDRVRNGGERERKREKEVRRCEGGGMG